MDLETQIKFALQEANENFLKDAFLFSTKKECTELKAVVQSNKWMVSRICELGFSSALEYLLQFNLIDINYRHNGWTPLQYACKAGHDDVVRHLLQWDAELKQDAWAEDSEFYLVSRYGHANICERLLIKYKDIVKDADVSYCLLYAACLGGQLPLVHKWLKPEHDVNQTVQLVSSLDQCEFCYPLFAACRGQHMDVAKFLMEHCEAILTKEISENCVDFTTQLIKELTLVPSSRGEQLFCLTKLKIECPLLQWFLPEAAVEPDASTESNEDNVTDIIILSEGNGLQELPAQILWHLTGLVQLDVSKNSFLYIEDPIRPADLAMNRLVSLDVSHCKLESISGYVFHLPCLEDLNLSHNHLTELGTVQDSWKCERLKILNVSNNSLTSLPYELQGCPHMESLTASHNKIVSLCPSWACPLSALDLSHNQLRSFLASADTFWRNTLKRIFIQHNLLDELPLTIVAIDSLRHLNASHNKIVKLPEGRSWRCRLFYLNLGNNEIGIGVRKGSLSRVMSVKNPAASATGFVGVAMSRTLCELYLGDNSLKSVPPGIEDMSNLSLLDLKNNPELKSLPCELGRLQKLLLLGLEGVTVEDKELQAHINDLNDENKRDVSAKDVIRHLEHKRRHCVPPYLFKIVVLGKERKPYELSLVQKLANHKKKPEDFGLTSYEEMFVTQIPLRLNRQNCISSGIQGKAVLWEFPDTEFSSAVLPCFLTLNSLYVLQIEITSTASQDLDVSLKKLAEKVASIQACVFRPQFLVVLMYPDSFKKADVSSVEEVLSQRQRQRQFDFSALEFLSIRSQKQSLDRLWETIENTCMNMVDAQFDKKKSLAQRKVPELFLTVWERVMSAKDEEGLMMCTMDKFLELAKCSQEQLKDCLELEYTLEEFLLQTGAILRYSDFNQDLSNCVFLKPASLFQILIKFLKSLTTPKSRLARLPIAEVKRRAEQLLPANFDYFPGFVALLEAFNIGFRIQDSSSRNVLVIPSLLQEYPPTLDLPEYPKGLKAGRLYCLPAVPTALWSHVISQLILAFNRFSQAQWKLGQRDSSDSVTLSDMNFTSGIEHHKSFKLNRRKSMKGLQLSDKNIQYWRTGTFISHNQGYMVVEEVECRDKNGHQTLGILVTVQTNGSNTLEENLRKLAVIGIIKDELEEILEMFLPKFRDPSVTELKPYVLCPHCHNIRPMSGSIQIDGLHFTARDCAQALLRKDIITCQMGPTLLKQLVPELFFFELPPALRIKFEDLELKTGEVLGRGIAGEVLKGCYKGQEVAVKVFHQQRPAEAAPVTTEQVLEASGKAHYTNCHPQKLFGGLISVSEDRWEAEQSKISNAFSEVRREVGILSKLQHRCVVTFLGVCVQPHLLLVMELAPLGNLRSELERHSAASQPRQSDPASLSGHTKTISQMIFSKNLTYKMILQIACGLSHLHSHQIIFRDLKPDNILVMNLDEDASVNVKLADYGISKFATLQGTSGLCGTVGYMAPEVTEKQAYTHKVDIFSLGIVMGEILTGIPPLDPDQPSKVSQVTSNGHSPSHMEGLKVQCNFPCLEALMTDCWSSRSERRPDAADVVKTMKSAQFLLMHDSVWLDEGVGLEVSCISTCETNGRWTVWICESGSGHKRFFSVYDISANCFSIWRRESSQGPAVNAMLRVGSRVWLTCQGERVLYVLSRGLRNTFEITPEICLDALPTSLIQFKSSEAKGRIDLLLSGLQDGSVTSIVQSVCGKVSTKTRLEPRGETDGGRVGTCYPISSICQVGKHCVAAASGQDIHAFRLTFHDSSAVPGPVPTATFAYRDKVSVKSVAQSFPSISCMVSESENGECDTNTLWCCLETEPYLVLVDLEGLQIVLVICVSWSPELDTIRLEKHMSWFVHQRVHAASDSDVKRLENPMTMRQFSLQASCSRGKADAVKALSSSDLIDIPEQLGSANSCTGNNDVFFATDMAVETQRTECKGSNIQNSSRNISGNDSVDTVSTGTGNISSYRSNNSIVDETSGMAASCNRPDIVVTDTMKEGDESSGAANNMQVTKNSSSGLKSVTLDIDSKHMADKQKNPAFGRPDTCRSQSLPSSFALKPPPIPPRQARMEMKVNLNCLAMSEDVLMIGTSCGGIIALPLTELNCDNNAEGINLPGSGLPLQFGVFRHQQKLLSNHRGEGGSRQRRASTLSSISTISSIPITITPQLQIPQGEITLLLPSGSKIVSVHNRHKKVIHRSRTISRNESSQNARRNAQVLTLPLEAEAEDGDWILLENESNNDIPVTMPCREDPVDCVADVTVWDHISAQRLDEIKSYGFDLI